ncbi:hypothetical protein AM305_09241, partial [Actinobacillus minor NM305]
RRLREGEMCNERCQNISLPLSPFVNGGGEILTAFYFEDFI